MSLDFKKTFDSLEWGFIMTTLDVFNFGTTFKLWISTFDMQISKAQS